ncbi:MAG: hypothetical protein A2Z40_05700 [Deltaproteobacteria bacterium RBG_19FT_COMBO_60_16]|nr:MAG: hypothetical protein A2Z40_05700 [Deltaproteobacteria bacterium RBG_19FT_COMBO_60_16]
MTVCDSYHRPHTMRYELLPRIDWRTSNRREAAISIIRLLEKSANGNGGASLVFHFYVEDASWSSFTGREQRIIAKTVRAFAKALREAGFLPTNL